MSAQTIKIGGDLEGARIGLGAMRLTGEHLWGPYPDQAAGTAFLQEAVAAGVTLIDTADVYGPHASEQLIRDALHPYADGLVVATKGGFVRGNRDFDSFQALGNAKYLQQSARLSARRLGVECIDLYYLHSGRATDAPFAEQVGKLAALRKEGVIRHIGLSNVTPDQFAEAREITDIAAVTAHFNIVDRANTPLLEMVEAAGAVFVPWQPISLIPPRDARTDINGSEDIRHVIEPIAEAHDPRVSQISLAWLLKHSDATLPIPGTTNIDRLRQNLAAQDITLTSDEVAALDAIAA